MNNQNVYRFWNGRKVLVTGHTGYVGAWLCTVLDYFGADITGFSLREEEKSLYSKIHYGIKVNNYYGDLRNPIEIEKCICETKPEIVFHLAAYSFIKKCLENPQIAFETNVMGTLNLFEAIKKNPHVNKIIVASSDKVYKNNDKEVYLFKEEDSLGGIDTYSCSKTMEDLLAQSYYETYFKSKDISMVILRPSNILGGGDHNTSRLIPYILTELINKRTPKIRNPKAVRPWQHILDMTDAYIRIGGLCTQEAGIYIYNVGPQKKELLTVEEIVKIIMGFCNIIDDFTLEKNENRLIEAERNYLGLSIEKIKLEEGWLPAKNIKETLFDAYTFEKYKDQSNEIQLCKQQIEDYYLNKRE